MRSPRLGTRCWCYSVSPWLALFLSSAATSRRWICDGVHRPMRLLSRRAASSSFGNLTVSANGSRWLGFTIRLSASARSPMPSAIAGSGSVRLRRSRTWQSFRAVSSQRGRRVRCVALSCVLDGHRRAQKTSHSASSVRGCASHWDISRTRAMRRESAERSAHRPSEGRPRVL